MLIEDKTVEEIHDYLLSMNVEEHDIFLFITAGKLLNKTIKESEDNYRPPFGRK